MVFFSGSFNDVQGDSVGKVNILSGDSIDHRKKKIP